MRGDAPKGQGGVRITKYTPPGLAALVYHSLWCDCHWQSFIRFAARRTALINEGGKGRAYTEKLPDALASGICF